MKNQLDVLLTGIPRSGTSLITKLISEQPNTLCFSEPAWMKSIRFQGQTQHEFIKALKNKIDDLREEIKKGNPIEITVKKGTLKLPDNYFILKNSKQQNLKETVKVNIEYSNQLKIFVKTNTLFTVCLPQLIESKHWKIVSMIRDPLFILLSWRNLNIPISHGKIKIGELYSKEIREIAKIDDLLLRQVYILDWFFKQYIQNEIHLYKYERLISEPNNILSEILEHNTQAQLNLSSSNITSRYNDNEEFILSNTLQTHGKHYIKFYK